MEGGASKRGGGTTGGTSGGPSAHQALNALDAASIQASVTRPPASAVGQRHACGGSRPVTGTPGRPHDGHDGQDGGAAAVSSIVWSVT